MHVAKQFSLPSWKTVEKEELKQCHARLVNANQNKTGGNTLGQIVAEKREGGIGDAIAFLFEGKRVARLGWSGPAQYLELKVPGKDSEMMLFYVFISTLKNHVPLAPWTPSQTDLLATDWYIVSD